MSAPQATGLAVQLRERLTDDVWRSLAIMLVAAALVTLAFATGLGQRAVEHGVHSGPHAAGHEAGAHAAAVRSEATFIAAMIPHHEEAVTSAEAIAAISEREEVLALANDIIEVQGLEIAALRAVLADWYPDQGPVAYEPMMRPFTGLRPAEADQVFVADMIHHHEGAIEMAQAYLSLRGTKRPEVVALANDIIAIQRAEIAALQLMLQMWGVSAPDHGAH